LASVWMIDEKVRDESGDLFDVTSETSRGDAGT